MTLLEAIISYKLHRIFKSISLFSQGILEKNRNQEKFWYFMKALVMDNYDIQPFCKKEPASLLGIAVGDYL